MRKLSVGAASAAVLAYVAFGIPSCLDSIPIDGVGGGDAGYDGGFDIDSDGEICSKPDPTQIRAHFEPSRVFLTPCAAQPCPARAVRLVIEPDLCDVERDTAGDVVIDSAGNAVIIPVETPLVFTAGDDSIVRAPIASGPEECSLDPNSICVGYHRPSVPVSIEAGAHTGSTSLEASFVFGGKTFKTSLDVEVLSADVPTCSGTAKTAKLAGGDTLKGKAGLVGASIALPKGADKPNTHGFVWHTDPFAASIGCSTDVVPAGYVALGPAVTFGPTDLTLQREIPVTIPINPALMPEKARLRHLRVAYSGPAFKKPRTIPVADTRIVEVDGQWALSFQIPRLGTYQAVVENGAGTHSFTRRITHRAVIGISMGGGGTAMMAARHHNLFDVMAPLGGPVDWTWELNYIENNHLAGFRPIAPGTQLADIPLVAATCDSSTQCKPDETCLGVIANMTMSGKCALLPKPTEPYLHPQTYNFWWYEYPSAGNGGHFSRQDYTQIFRDLAIMFGNPNGDNLSPGGQNLPAGVPPTDKSVLGDHKKGECKMWVDPIDGDPHETQQQEIAQNCPIERCNHTLSLDNYYNYEYNPDGTFPVITICDSSPQIEAATPYSNEWQPGFTTYPLEVGLAVDYNGNGVRDELEPVIRSGHERFDDFGVDHTPSSLEKGYKKGVDEDPAGDDYSAQYNPTGTEGDHRWEPGEKFYDYGLDGVPGTKQQPKDGWKKPGDGYDVGEGDGKFTMSHGLQEFLNRDPHSIVRGFTDPSKIPAGELTDDALKRMDVWTDGGTRDLFNFSVDAQNLVGAFYARGRDVQYLSDFSFAPGSDPAAPDQFDAKSVVFEDLPGIVFERYGAVDETPTNLDSGSGQHVGTGSEILKRVQTAMYFIGAHWPEPELRTETLRSKDDPDPKAPECEVDERCDITFTNGNRTGPVSISLPPGYARRGNTQHYPVVYFLHGYGQDPSGLAAVEALFTNWMNNPRDSIATRMPKAIVVYVDGRCRWQNGKPECLRGTFFTNSVMDQGAQDESWWLDLMDHVDHQFRTLGESEIDWTE